MTAQRQTVSDRRFASARYTAAIGPVDLPGGVHGIDERLTAIAAQGPHTRVGLSPSLDSARWVHDLTRGTAVTVSDLDVTDIGGSMQRAADTSSAALDIRVADDHLFVTCDHGIGDGVFITELLAALTQPSTPTFPSFATADATPVRRPSAHAFASAMRHRPRDVVDAAHGILGGRGADAGQATRTAAEARTRSVFVGSEPGFPSRLRDLRDRDHPAASATTTMTWLIDRRLRAAGVELAENITLMVNLRRYLPQGSVSTSNFVGAVTAPAESPAAMSATIRSVVGGADLVVRQALADALGALRPAGLREPHVRRWVHGAPTRLIVSDLSGSPAIASTRWSTTSTVPRIFGVATVCTRSDELNLVYSRVDDTMFVTARFFDGAHDPDVVGTALREALSDPVGAV